MRVSIYSLYFLNWPTARLGNRLTNCTYCPSLYAIRYTLVCDAGTHLFLTLLPLEEGELCWCLVVYSLYFLDKPTARLEDR